MAAKKFTIPSLGEMEKSKREEYKVKTLFDKHKREQSSPEKNEECSANIKVNGPNVTKSTGPQFAQRSIGSSVSKTNEKKSSNDTDRGDAVSSKGNKTKVPLAGQTSSVIIKGIGDSEIVNSQKSGQTTLQSGNMVASTGLTVGSHRTTGISPNRPSKTTSLIVSTRQVILI